MRTVFFLTVTCWMVVPLGSPPGWGAEADEAKPLAQAHAHNDYHHPRPLMDALDQGFCSVEADIYLVDEKLLVGHDRSELREDRTLQRLYLDPLLERVRKNGGRVYSDGPTVTLLVDIKEDGKDVYAVLAKVLRGYEEMLSGMDGDRYVERAVQIVISGDRPMREIAADDGRLVGIDGRLADLDTEMSAQLMPLISDRWSSHFQWQGTGRFPDDQKEKLHAIVQRAHAGGRRVRFWATPESQNVWQELLSAGVDHINTDQLSELRNFLEQHASGSSARSSGR